MLDHARSNQTWTTAVAALACFLMTLDITVVNVALPSIQKDLGASLEGLQWVVNAYVLAFAALLLTVGSVSDRLGRKRLFLTGVAVFTVASALCVASRTESPLIAARALQGIGGALVFGTCLALIADAYTDAEEEQRRKAVGLAMAAGAAAATLGPLIGGGSSKSGRGNGSSPSTCPSASPWRYAPHSKSGNPTRRTQLTTAGWTRLEPSLP